MSIRSKYALLLIIVFFSLVTALYSLVPVLPRMQGHFPMLSGADGAYYALRLKMALEGDSVISCPFDASLRSSETFIPSYFEFMWASFLRPWVGVDINLAMTITYVVLPAVLFLLFVFFLYQVFEDLILAGWLGFWALIDPSVYFWKFFFVSQVDSHEPLPYFRYANPMLFSIPFIIAYGCMFSSILANRRHAENILNWKTILILVGAGGMLFYTQIYYANFFVLVLCFYVVISALRGKWRSSLVTTFIIGGMFLVGAPEVLKNLNLFVSPLVPDVLYRIGCLVQKRYPNFLFHKGIIFTFIFYQAVCWKHWNVRWKFLTASMLGGFFCLNQNLITGFTSHDQHYFRALMVPYVFTVADVWIRLQKKISKENVKLVLKSIGALGILFCFFRGGYKVVQLIQASSGNIEGEYVSHRILKTVQLIKEHVQVDKGLVLANPDFTYDLEILADASIYIDEYFYHCIVSDDLLFKRWAFMYKAFGRGVEHVSKNLKNFGDSANLPYWFFGLPASYLGAKNIYSDQFKSRIHQWVKAYSDLNLDDLVQYEKDAKGLPKYLLETAGFEADMPFLRRYFKVSFLGEVPEEKAKLWKLEYVRSLKD